MGHLDTQRSLPVVGADKTGLSPLAKKLRLAAEHQLVVLNAPDGYLGLLKPGPAAVTTELHQGMAYDAVLLFVKDVDELRRLAPSAIRATRPNGLLCITYPTGGKTGGVTALPPPPCPRQPDVLAHIPS